MSSQWRRFWANWHAESLSGTGEVGNQWLWMGRERSWNRQKLCSHEVSRKTSADISGCCEATVALRVFPHWKEGATPTYLHRLVIKCMPPQESFQPWGNGPSSAEASWKRGLSRTVWQQQSQLLWKYILWFSGRFWETRHIKCILLCFNFGNLAI